MRAQVVGATPPGTRGAIAVPLVTAAGCVGVLAAELHHGRPGTDTLAVARMIAAQVAALVGPDDVAAARAAQA
jgi:GAF domain-containing protein